MINKLQLELDKAEESGILSREEAINFLNERTQQIKEFIQNNPGEADLSRVKKAIGGGVIEGEDLGTREGFARVAYKQINELTDENRANFKYPPDHKYKVQIPTREDLGPGSLRTVSAKTKKELKKLVDESPITKIDYSKGLIKESKLELPEGAISFDKSRYKMPTGEYVGKGRNRSQIFSLHSKFNPDAAVRYFTSPGRRLFNSIEEAKAGKAKVSKDMSRAVKTKTERVAKNIVKNTYEIPATGETYEKFKPFIGEEKITIEGEGADTLEEAQKFVDDYRIKNPVIQAGTKELNKKLISLFEDPRIKKILRTGRPSKKDLDIVKDILGGTDRQAQEKLAQLADAVDPKGQRTIDGIPKIDGKKAKNIFNFHKTKDIAKDLEDIAIAESVGEKKSLGTIRGNIQSSIPMKGGLEGYSVDEAKARASSVRLNSKPYSIWGQVIAGDVNQGIKQTFDANLSLFEEQVKNAIKNNEDPTELIRKYNKRAAEAEAAANQYKSRNTKKIIFPRITTDPPNKAIKNKSAYNKYKKYFDKNYKQQGYSFVIPKDLQPLPSLAEDLKNKDSSTYKNMIKQIKDAGRKFIKNIDQFDEKELFEKLQNDPNFKTIRRIMPRLVSNDEFLDRRYAFAENIMTDAGPVNLMPAPKEDEEQTFAERNPITTGVGLTVPSAVAVQKAAGVPVLKALANIGKYPLKAVGSLPGAAYFAGDTIAERLEEGKSIPDAVIDKEVGIELLLPEAFKRFGPLMMKAARLSTPLGLGITGAGLAKDYYNFAKDEIAKVKAMSPEERQAYNESLMNYSVGGRVGFADGPEDPSKRKFMKIMGGLASLPIVGRFFEIGEKAAPVVQNIFTEVKKLKDTKTLMPDWFPSFVDKFRKEGKAENMFKKKRIEVTEQEYNQAVAEGKGQNYFRDDARTPEYKAENPNHMDYYKIEDTDELVGTTYTNDKFPGVEIDDFDGEVQVNWENDYSQPVNIVYVKPGAKGPEMGRPDKFQSGISEQEVKPQGEFSAMDQEVYATDPDGGYDTNAVIVDTLDDMMEGTTRQMEEYATGKKVKKLSKGEGKVIEAEVRANQMADEAGELDQADYEGDPINLMDDRDYGDAGFDD
jgi:hypothetical protein